MKRVFVSIVLASLLPVLFATPGVSADSGGPTVSGLSASPEAFNPNTGSTNIEYTLNDVTDGNVLLEIYDSTDTLIRTISAGNQSSGTHSITWDGKDDYGIVVTEGSYTVVLNVFVGSENTYEFVLKWGGEGSGDGQFQGPFGIAVDSGGNVYVADQNNHRIQKFASITITTTISAETSVIVDTTPPELTVPDDVTVEANTTGGATITLPSATANDAVDPEPEVTCDHNSGFFQKGVTTVNCTATDAAGNSTSGSFRVTVVDTTPPVITVSVSPDTLWPPNNNMVEVMATVAVSDICDPAPIVVLSSIVSNKPVDANNIQGAVIGTEDYSFLLQAERAGKSGNHIYTITYTVTDTSGNSASADATVTVLHDQGKKSEKKE